MGRGLNHRVLGVPWEKANQRNITQQGEVGEQADTKNDYDVENENLRGLKIVAIKLGQEKNKQTVGQCSSALESQACVSRLQFERC